MNLDCWPHTNKQTSKLTISLSQTQRCEWALWSSRDDWRWLEIHLPSTGLGRNNYSWCKWANDFSDCFIVAVGLSHCLKSYFHTSNARKCFVFFLEDEKRCTQLLHHALNERRCNGLGAPRCTNTTGGPQKWPPRWLLKVAGPRKIWWGLPALVLCPVPLVMFLHSVYNIEGVAAIVSS